MSIESPVSRLETGLWDGARRLPYFYTLAGDGDPPEEWVFCPQCALEHRGENALTAQYVTLRNLMCCRCGILIGPINEPEARHE